MRLQTLCSDLDWQKIAEPILNSISDSKLQRGIFASVRCKQPTYLERGLSEDRWDVSPVVPYPSLTPLSNADTK